MEMVGVPGLTEDEIDGVSPVPHLLVSPFPLPTSFRVAQYTLHGAEKKADS